MHDGYDELRAIHRGPIEGKLTVRADFDEEPGRMLAGTTVLASKIVAAEMYLVQAANIPDDLQENAGLSASYSIALPLTAGNFIQL